MLQELRPLLIVPVVTLSLNLRHLSMLLIEMLSKTEDPSRRMKITTNRDYIDKENQQSRLTRSTLPDPDAGTEETDNASLNFA